MSTEPMTSSALESTRRWYPVPGFAIPVTVSLDAYSDLDPMTHAILELCRAKPRTKHTLFDLFEGFDRDIITSALGRLLDLGVLVYNIDAHLYEADEEAMARGIAEEIEHGWVYCYKALEEDCFHALPTLWLGERARPFLEHAFFEQSKAHNDLHKRWRDENGYPDRIQVQRTIGEFLRLEEIAVHRDLRDGGPEHASSSNRVLFADYERRTESLVHHVTVWIAVDFIPRASGPATMVYREPTIVPSHDLPLLVSDRVRNWLENDKVLEPIQREIWEHSHAHSREWTSLLEEAGISDEEEFRRLRDEHEAQLRRRFGLEEVSRVPNDPGFEKVLDTVRDALRWRTLAKEQPTSSVFCSLLANSIAHGIERLCKALSDYARPRLEHWATETWEQFVQIPNEPNPWKAFRNQRKQINWYNDRAGDVRLHASFHKSRGFICNTLGSLSKSGPFNFETSGAGMNLTHWLLPAFLLEVSEARVYAAPIASACRHFVGLNADLLELIDARNSTFHSREDKPDSFDELDHLCVMLFRCTHTLVAAYSDPG